MGNEAGRAVTYGALSQSHGEYDAALWDKLRLFYRGGFEVLERAEEFLHRAPKEQADRYQYRIKHASYICYFGQVTDYLVGALFHEKLQVTPASKGVGLGRYPNEKFYAEFARNADRARMPFSGLMARAMTTALICRRAWIAVDLPPPAPFTPASLAEEDAWGVNRAYAFERAPEEILNWHNDDSGKLVWLVTRRRVLDRESPFTKHEEYRDRFKIWMMTPEGRAAWVLFETEPHKRGEDPGEDEPLHKVAEGLTSFERIPFVQLELPWGLWAGNKIGPLAIEHFQRRSDLRGSLAHSLVEIPYVKLGPEVPGIGDALPAERAQDPHRGDQLDRVQAGAAGYMTLGHLDEVGFASPNGRGYEAADKGLTDLRDEIYRTVTAMALSLNNSGAAVARSGESKREDRSATEVVLEALGELARRAAVEVYELVADGRNDAKTTWEASGCSTFNVDALGDLIDDAERVLGLNIPSTTFKKRYLTHIALRALPNASPETKADFQREIEEGVEEGDATAQLLRSRLAPGADQTDDDDDQAEPGDAPSDPGAARGRRPAPPAG